MPTCCRVLAALAVISLVASCPASAQSPSLEEVAARMAAYVSDFGARFANVVAAETYEQRYRAPSSTTSGTQTSTSPLTRQLRSDLLLVRSPTAPADWMVFRDVVQMDGTPVHHEPDRLQKLFVEPTADAVVRAAQLNRESVRFHMGGASVSVTNPLLVLALMHPHYQPRLRLTLGGEERSLGPGVRVVRFEERTETGRIGEGGRAAEKVTPLLEGTVRGNVWVEATTGRIVKTEGRMAGALRVFTTITTFARDERLAVIVPVEMRTTWTHTDRQGTLGGLVNGTAKYTNFRRFDVKTETSVILPKP